LYDMATDFSAYEDISSEDPYPPGWRPSAWTPQSGRFPDTGTDIKLTDSLGVKQITMTYRDEGGTQYTSSPSEFTLKDIPADGSTVEDAIVWTNGAAISPLNLQIAGYYDAATNSVQLYPAGFNRFFNFNGAHTFVLQLTDATDVWQNESGTFTGRYGYSIDEDDPLPAADGGNAVVDSVAAYGERDATIEMTGYGLRDAAVLEDVARAYVYEAINPTLVRTVEQSVWRAFPVKFSDLGRVIELPNGEQGRLINRTYADDFGTSFGDGVLASTIKVEVTDTSGAGYVDVDTTFLLLDDNSFFTLDDGSNAEAG